MHYQQVGEIHAAVLLDDLGAVRAPARALANTGNEYGPQAADAWGVMTTEARAVQTSSDLVDVARPVARMGSACGACHTALEAGPVLLPGDPPSASPRPTEHMQRHKWALDELWDGLVGPSEACWAAGAAALGYEPMRVGPSADEPGRAQILATELHELRDEARQARDWPARAEVYGAVLRTCTECHELLGMRMR